MQQKIVRSVEECDISDRTKNGEAQNEPNIYSVNCRIGYYKGNYELVWTKWAVADTEVDSRYTQM